MSSNIVDFLTEKMLSFSSKMREDSFQQYGTPFLMSGGNNNSYWDPLKAVNVLKENVLDFEDGSPFYSDVLLNQILGIVDFNHSFKFHHNIEKPECKFSHTKNGLFSPHLLNLMNDLNSYHYRNALFNMSLLSINSNFGNIMNNLFSESPKGKQNSNFNSDEKTCSLPVSELTKENSIPNSDLKKTCSLPVNELKMSVNISQLPIHKTDSSNNKCSLSTNAKLNVKLANRKTKQMNRRSKKRRRRQKKSQAPGVVNSVTLSNGGTDSNSQSPVSSRMCFIAQSPDFECKISFQRNVQTPPHASFVVAVGSNSDDDSEWDSYDEVDYCNPNHSTSDSEVLSSDPSPVTLKDTESKCSSPKVNVTSSIISFVVPEGDTSDDDSDWDSCEPDTFIETPDFEFTGLFISNLCTPKIVSSNADCKIIFGSDDETEETSQLRKELLEVNKNWDSLTEGDNAKPKSASKVTFAPDEDLVEVFPVEIYQRKGEWETYATERLRFKRKIDELEKVLSPCLHPDHRTKIFKKLMDSEL